MSYYDDDLTDRAVRLYFRRGRRLGYDLDQPNRNLTGIDGDHVVLANVNGELARFRILPGGRLRFVRSRAVAV